MAHLGAETEIGCYWAKGRFQVTVRLARGSSRSGAKIEDPDSTDPMQSSEFHD